MRLALAIEGGFRGEAAVAAPVDPAVAAVLAGWIGAEIVVLPAEPGSGACGVARLLAVTPGGDGRFLAELAPQRKLGIGAISEALLHANPPLQLIADESYAAMLAAADADLFPAQPTSPLRQGGEAATPFAHLAPAALETASLVIATLRRETGNLCALTGVPLPEDALPTVIRPGGTAALHVNNLLLLSPPAEQAFRDGHFAARDDFSAIVDLTRIDPDLLERINPNGRLRVPANPALRPAPENLAWHRRFVFGLI
ncbi:MAG: hypothetical protein ACTHOR_06680 [Devosia sp.]